jgi:quinol monooxygenase YgiN
LNPSIVTIVEKWESPEALDDHLAAPHMAIYREKVKDLAEAQTLKILRDA